MALPSDDRTIDWPFEPFPEAATSQTVAARFGAIAERFANDLAVSDATQSFTYAGLARLADRITAAVIAAKSTGPVAILLPNEARYPAAMLGIMAAGRGYVALDTNHPAERNQAIARHAKVGAVVTAGALAQSQELFGSVPVIDLESLPDAGDAANHAVPDDLAWIIYTSGSTGVPKGVYQSQRGLLDDARRATNSLHLSHRDRQFLYASPSLYAGTRIVFGSLLNGGSVHCFSPEEIRAADFGQALISRGITIVRSVPSVFRHAVETLEPGRQLSGVRLVYLGGDRVDWRDYDFFSRACGDHAVFGVHLGSTECAGTYIQLLTRKGMERRGERLPIGSAVRDYGIALVDEDNRPVADGEVGEFVVSGRHLALGYWQDPASPKFGTDPGDPALRTFRTGDLGLRRPDGLYEYRGRKDDQVKIAGHRVEPAEIERALAACQGVRTAATVVRYTESGAAVSVVAYVELEPGVRGLLPRHLHGVLKRQLPKHLLPATIYLLPALPQLANLKIDRQALRWIDMERSRHSDDRASNPTLDQVARIFEEILETTGATPEDNVLSLGGDSLKTISIGLALEQRFGKRIPDELLITAPTIREIAGRVAVGA